MPSSPQAASEHNPNLVASVTRAGFGFGSYDAFFALLGEIHGKTVPFKAEVEQGRVRVVCNWRQGFEGRGCERYPTGEIYVGEYMGGERGGRGTFKHANGQTLVSAWRMNAPVGIGVQWAKDGRKCAKLQDGKPTASITIEEGAEIAEKLGIPVPREWLENSYGKKEE